MRQSSSRIPKRFPFRHFCKQCLFQVLISIPALKENKQKKPALISKYFFKIHLYGTMKNKNVNISHTPNWHRRPALPHVGEHVGQKEHL